MLFFLQMDSLKDKTVRGVIWSCVERFSVQGVNFLVMLVIARLLGPKAYGLIGMLAIFIAISQSLVDSGFSQALIRKTDRTEEDNCTVFFFNVVVSLILYCILFLAAPIISIFYNEPELCAILRVLGVVIIINGFAIVQRALFTIDINFKVQTKATLIAAVISGCFGIVTAYNGYGAWALVWQQLTNVALSTSLLWLSSSWRPHLTFSLVAFGQMFGFGSKMMISGILNTVYNNVYQLVIGKLFSATDLGYFTRANQFAQMPASSLTEVMQRVMFPVLCKIQDERERYCVISAKFLRLSAFVVFPVMCFIAGISRPLVISLLGDEWSESISMMIPLCFAMMLLPVHALNLNSITVIGRSDLFLRLEIIKKVIGVIILVISVPFGVVVMCYASILGSFLGLFVNAYYTKREVGYGLLDQLKDLLPIILLSALVFVVSYIISYNVDENWLSMVLSALSSIFIFVILIKIMHFQEIEDIIQIVK